MKLFIFLVLILSVFFLYSTAVVECRRKFGSKYGTIDGYNYGPGMWWSPKKGYGKFGVPVSVNVDRIATSGPAYGPGFGQLG